MPPDVSHVSQLTCHQLKKTIVLIARNLPIG